MSRLKRLAKEGSWILFGQIAAIAGALALVRILTEYLDAEQYGQLALGLSIAALVNQVVLGGIGNGIGRFYSIAAEKQDLGSYLRATRRLLLLATAVALVIGVLLTIGLLWLGYPEWIGLAGAALVFSILGGYNRALSNIQNAARQRAIVAVHSGMDAWLKILLALGVLLWFGASGVAVVLAYALSSLLVTLSQLVFLRRTVPWQDLPYPNERRLSHQMWGYSLPFATWSIFTGIQQISDRWALQVFASTAEVGQYAVLYQLGYTPIALATGMMVTFMGPILFQRSGDATDYTRNSNVHKLGWQMTRLALFFTLAGFAITLAIHEWLFSLLVAEEFRTISYLLPWVVLAGGIFAAGQMLALKLGSEMKPGVMTKPKIVTAILGLLLNVIGAALAGMPGVVAALIAFSVIFFVWIALLARETVGENKEELDTT